MISGMVKMSMTPEIIIRDLGPTTLLRTIQEAFHNQNIILGKLRISNIESFGNDACLKALEVRLTSSQSS